MNNYERLRRLSLEQMAAEISGFYIAVVLQQAKPIYKQLKVEIPEITDEDKKQTYEAFLKHLKSEV